MPYYQCPPYAILSTLTKWILVCSVLITMLYAINTDAGDNLVPPVQRLKHSAAFRASIRGLFKNKSNSEVRQLTLHDNEIISVHATWELIRRSIPEPKERGRRLRPAHKLRREELARFVGFLEGRLQVSVPKSWEHMMVRLVAFDRDTLGVLFEKVPKAVVPYYTGNGGCAIRKGISLKIKGQSIILSNGSVSFDAPKIIVKEWGGEDAVNSIEAVTAYFTKRNCFLGFHSLGEGGYNVWCIEIGHKVKWSTRVFAGESPVGGGPPMSRHWVILTVQRNRLLVFGATDFQMYLEIFSVKDGTALFRFSTSY